jgi:hypothetical protein
VAILPPRKSKIINESSRQIKSSIDNTIYIYPILYEKFTHRNLCIKIQMVEFISSFDTRYPDPNMPYHILKNIYSTMIGPAFCNSAFTTVSYHTKLPILNEEIKIRLPDVLTDRHWLILTVHHVHVKQKAAPNKSFLGVFYNDSMYVYIHVYISFDCTYIYTYIHLRFSYIYIYMYIYIQINQINIYMYNIGVISFTPGELLDTAATIVGVGFLPLMSEGWFIHMYVYISIHI